MIKALVVDNDTVFKNLLCKLLGSHGIQVVGIASNSDQAAILYQAIWPDVVLVDLSSEDKDKIETLSKIREIDSQAKLIVLSIFNSVDDIAQGQGRLIDAHVVKGSSAKEIVNTVKEVVSAKAQPAICGEE